MFLVAMFLIVVTIPLNASDFPSVTSADSMVSVPLSDGVSRRLLNTPKSFQDHLLVLLAPHCYERTQNRLFEHEVKTSITTENLRHVLADLEKIEEQCNRPYGPMRMSINASLYVGLITTAYCLVFVAPATPETRAGFFGSCAGAFGMVYQLISTDKARRLVASRIAIIKEELARRRADRV